MFHFGVPDERPKVTLVMSLKQLALAAAALAACAHAALPVKLARRPGGARALLPPRVSTNVSSPVPCCPPFGPEPPPPYPSPYETRWFTQPRDHFNYLNPSFADGRPFTFEQRYLYIDRHWAGAPAPIIFVTCVEAGSAVYYLGEYGWVIDTLARELGALVVFAEHRGFGMTYPQPSSGADFSGWQPDAAHAGVLTEAQVLEDFTALATHLRTNLSAWDSPLIAAGGSLAGEMATWWRVRYPFMVDMALSASAPILGFPGLTDEYGWYRVATNAFRNAGGEACVEAIRSGYWQTAALAPAAVSAAFNTCTPATLPCHARQVADLVMDWTATAAELGSYPQGNARRSLTTWACAAAAAGGGGGLGAYQRLLAPQAPGQCLNISWYDCSSSGSGSGSGSGASAAPAARAPGYCAAHWNVSGSGCQDGWGYESCTTEIHPITGSNVTDFYPPDPPFNVSDRQAGCRQSFGSDLRVDALAMPRSFGQLDLARLATATSRIIWSSGENDPWSAQSVNRTLSPSLPYVFIKGGAHHSDLGNNYNRACALRRAACRRPHCCHTHPSRTHARHTRARTLQLAPLPTTRPSWWLPASWRRPSSGSGLQSLQRSAQPPRRAWRRCEQWRARAHSVGNGWL
jgi:lysosomal Pro-X carboxypeptidase